MSSIPTPEDVRRVVEIGDLPERNHAVTRGYLQFSKSFRRYLGDQVTWPGFAMWASAQAGRTIRKEDLSRALEDELGRSDVLRGLVAGPLRFSADYLFRDLLKLDPFEESSQAISRGNIKVYAEIGMEFARFLGQLDADPSFVWLPEFLDSLAPGEPPDGKGYLRRAFGAYHEAMVLPPGKARSELVFYGNACIGYHEQRRLQPEIEAGVDGATAPLREVGDKLAAYIPTGGSTVAAWLFDKLASDSVERGLQELANRLRALVRKIITQRMMELELPGGVLQLGQDLTGQFPLDLRDITHREVAKLIKVLDPTPNSLRETGALDWTCFEERIHFILDLFRCRQMDRRLLDEVPADLAGLT